MPLEAEDWLRIESIYHAARERPPEERDQFLSEACVGRADLRNEIESLLSHDPDALGLDRPAWNVLASLFDVSSQPQLPWGTHVGPYRIVSFIGAGGMGMVYEAEDIKLNRRVALKSLPGEPGDQKQAIERLWREARAASALNHPNIATIYGVEEYEGRPFIVMELLEGSSLKQVINTRALKLHEIIQIAIQIAEGLEAAHRKGIIHRDIKPANLFLTSTGQLKILDFGVAKLQQAAEVALFGPDKNAPQTSAAETLTSTGALVGTMAYMSMEQVSGTQLDTRTDLFSFGAVLYEMATGIAPFRGEHPAQLRDAILKHSPPPPSRVNPPVPSSLDRVILKALEKDREKRYQSAAEIRTDLLRILDSRSRAKSRRLALLVASVVSALIAIALWVIIRVSSNTEPKIVERQITRNPSGNSVTGGAISPDGKTIAYRDPTGLYLRSADSGETRQIALPRGFEDRISDLSWFPDGKRLLGTRYNPDDRDGTDTDAWGISINGDIPPRMLRRCVLEGSVSPDGQSLAYLGDGSPSNRSFGIWVCKFDSVWQRQLRARGVNEWLYSPVWSPDAQWIAYVHIRNTPLGFTTAIEVVPSAGGVANTVLADKKLPEGNSICDLYAGGSCLNWSRNGYLFFSARTQGDLPSLNGDHSIWEIPIDVRTAAPAGKARRLARWSDSGANNLSTTADGKRLLFLRNRSWPDVYLTELDSSGNKIATPRRFTMDDRGSRPTAWTLDSNSILFSSDRTTRREIFKQQLNETIPTPLIQSPQADLDDAVMTPDGRWLLYREFKHTKPLAMAWAARLMRRRQGGGPSDLVAEEPIEMEWGYSCGIQPQSSCILSQVEGTDYVFYALDPVKGKGPKLGKVKQTHWGEPEGWALSPDGSRIASVTEDGRIELLSVRDRTWSEIRIDQRWKKLETIAWSADGQSFFVACSLADSLDLIHVRLNGAATLLSHKGCAYNLPSPDGRYLAFEGGSSDSNVWMIESF